MRAARSRGDGACAIPAVPQQAQRHGRVLERDCDDAAGEIDIDAPWFGARASGISSVASRPGQLQYRLVSHPRPQELALAPLRRERVQPRGFILPEEPCREPYLS